MSNSKRHHYIPAFYLNYWAVTPEQQQKYKKVYRFWRNERKVVHGIKSTKYLCASAELYNRISGNLDRRVQHETIFLKEHDDVSAKIHKKLVAFGASYLTSKEKKDFTCFILGLRMRHPQFIKHIKSYGTNFAVEQFSDPRFLLQNNLAEINKTHPESILNFLNNSMPEFLPNIGIDCLPRVIRGDNYPQFHQFLYESHWFVIDFSPTGTNVLTSDNPFYTSESLDDPKCIAFTPLSPSKVLFITRTLKIQKLIVESSQKWLIQELNKTVINTSFETIIANSSKYEKIIKKYWN